MKLRDFERPDRCPRFIVNLGWGIRWGLSVAIGLCALAVMLYVAFGEGAFERQNTTLPNLFLYYIICGFIAGLLLGVLRPIVSTAIGAAIAGVVIAAAIVTSALLMIGGTDSWSAYDTFLVVAFALVFGVSGGLAEWSRN